VVRIVTDLLLNQETDQRIVKPQKISCIGLLDNVRSAWNVGSIFRTADGLGIQQLILGGLTPSPDQRQIAKTALGAEKVVNWISVPNSVVAIKEQKEKGLMIWALEENSKAVSLYQNPPLPASSSIILVVGNEIGGIDPDVLALSDRVVSIPMYGVKRSLNVAVAFGIAASYLLNRVA
jgi:tRNA G18 (ribose-2'-O)-methylase SpoU